MAFPKSSEDIFCRSDPAKEYILPHGEIYIDVFGNGVGYIFEGNITQVSLLVKIQEY